MMMVVVVVVVVLLAPSVRSQLCDEAVIKSISPAIAQEGDIVVVTGLFCAFCDVSTLTLLIDDNLIFPIITSSPTSVTAVVAPFPLNRILRLDEPLSVSLIDCTARRIDALNVSFTYFPSRHTIDNHFAVSARSSLSFWYTNGDVQQRDSTHPFVFSPGGALCPSYSNTLYPAVDYFALCGPLLAPGACHLLHYIRLESIYSKQSILSIDLDVFAAISTIIPPAEGYFQATLTLIFFDIQSSILSSQSHPVAGPAKSMRRRSDDILQITPQLYQDFHIDINVPTMTSMVSIEITVESLESAVGFPPVAIGVGDINVVFSSLSASSPPSADLVNPFNPFYQGCLSTGSVLPLTTAIQVRYLLTVRVCLFACTSAVAISTPFDEEEFITTTPTYPPLLLSSEDPQSDSTYLLFITSSNNTLFFHIRVNDFDGFCDVLIAISESSTSAAIGDGECRILTAPDNLLFCFHIDILQTVHQLAPISQTQYDTLGADGGSDSNESEVDFLPLFICVMLFAMAILAFFYSLRKKSSYQTIQDYYRANIPVINSSSARSSNPTTIPHALPGSATSASTYITGSLVSSSSPPSSLSSSLSSSSSSSSHPIGAINNKHGKIKATLVVPSNTSTSPTLLTRQQQQQQQLQQQQQQSQGQLRGREPGVATSFKIQKKKAYV
jgi:hypothetical protein